MWKKNSELQLQALVTRENLGVDNLIGVEEFVAIHIHEKNLLVNINDSMMMDDGGSIVVQEQSKVRVGGNEGLSSSIVPFFDGMENRKVIGRCVGMGAGVLVLLLPFFAMLVGSHPMLCDGE